MAPYMWKKTRTKRGFLVSVYIHAGSNWFQTLYFVFFYLLAYVEQQSNLFNCFPIKRKIWDLF